LRRGWCHADPRDLETDLLSFVVVMTELPTTPFDDLDPGAVLTATEIAERLSVHARLVRPAVAGRGDG
jgi:hypothetical protein